MSIAGVAPWGFGQLNPGCGPTFTPRQPGSGRVYNRGMSNLPDDIFGTPTDPGQPPAPAPEAEAVSATPAREPGWRGTPGVDETALLTAAMIGKDTRTVHVYGHPVTMHTPTVGETLQAAEAAKQYNNTRGGLLALKTALLAAAIDDVDGAPLYTPAQYGENTVAAKNRVLLSEYTPAFIEAAYKHYETMEQEQAKLLDDLGKAQSPSVTDSGQD